MTAPIDGGQRLARQRMRGRRGPRVPKCIACDHPVDGPPDGDPDNATNPSGLEPLVWAKPDTTIAQPGLWHKACLDAARDDYYADKTMDAAQDEADATREAEELDDEAF